MRLFPDTERKFRHIETDSESDLLNWKDEKRQNGTASLIVLTRKTYRKMGIQMKLMEKK
jgi:hypothetical protein